MRLLLITITGCLAGGTVYAHEGHGHSDGYTIIHYLTEPVHAVAVLVAFVAGMVTWWRARRKTFKK